MTARPPVDTSGLRLAAALAAYAVAFLVGEALAPSGEGATFLRPASYLLVAMVLGMRARPWALLVPAAAVHFALASSYGHSAAEAAGSAASDAVLALATLSLHRRWVGRDGGLDRVRDVFRFCLGVAPLSAALAAAMATGLRLAFAPDAAAADAPIALPARVFLGTLTGLVVVVPVAIARTTVKRPDREPATPGARAALVAGVALVGVVAFGQPWLFGAEFVHLRYAPLPLLVWVALQLGPRDTAAATLLVSVLAVGATHLNADGTPDDAMLLALFLVTTAVTALALAAATAERAAAEERVAERTDFLDRVIDSARIGVWDVDIGRRVVRVDAGWRAMLGYPEEMAELTVDEAFAIIHPDDRNEAKRRWEGFLLVDPPPLDFVLRLRCADHTWKWVLARGSALVDESGRAVRVVGVNTDVTELRRAIDSTRDAEARFRAAAEGSLDAFCLLSNVRGVDGAIEDFTVTYLSRNGAWMFGRRVEDTLGRRLSEVVPDLRRNGFLRRLAKAATSGRLFAEEMRIDAEGFRAGRVHVQVVATPDGVAVTLRDVTEQRRLERDLRQAQKMEGLGRLAGGVAHDFNNLLTIMRGYCEMLRAQDADGSPSAPLLDQVLGAADRASELTERLLAFSRRERLESRRVDVAAVLRETEPAIRRLAGERVQVEIVPPPRRTWTVAELSGLEHSLVDLAANAVEAMPDGGRLLVAADEGEVTAEEAVRHAEARAGRFVRIVVQDTGQGMSPEVMARVFEPFFTVHAGGRGTGLGLAICYAVVKQAGGFVTVESEPGAGSRFVLHLPVAEAPADEPPDSDTGEVGDVVAVGDAGDAGPAAPRTAEAAPQSAEVATVRPATILVVEDEPAVRRILVQGLRKAGHRVLETGGGDEAFAASRLHAGTIDLVVTDVMMPGFRGPEVAALLRAERPGIRVLFVSGYTADSFCDVPGETAPPVILSKPFTLAALHEKVREVLTASPVGV